MDYNYKKKSIWKWILLYVVIGAVAYGLVYYFFFYNKGGYNDNSQYPITNSQQNSQISNTETAGWKTYRNDKYGFEFKYPSTLQIETGPAYQTSAILEINLLAGGETKNTSHVFIMVYVVKDLIRVMSVGESNGVVNFKNKNGDVLVQINHDARSDEDLFNIVKSTFKFTK